MIEWSLRTSSLVSLYVGHNTLGWFSPTVLTAAGIGSCYFLLRVHTSSSKNTVFAGRFFASWYYRTWDTAFLNSKMMETSVRSSFISFQKRKINNNQKAKEEGRTWSFFCNISRVQWCLNTCTFSMFLLHDISNILAFCTSWSWCSNNNILLVVNTIWFRLV